ncbi:MAG: transposase, partial [Pseudomonadota bacterium]
MVVKFSALELSSDAGILLARQAEESLQVCAGMADCIDDWRDPTKIVHSLPQLVSQRVYQLVGGYEDANDSNHLRHDPIYKLACGRVPETGDNLL